MVTVADGLGLHARRVGSGVRLAQAVREHRVALGQRAQVLRLQLLGAGEDHRQRAELVDRRYERGRAADAGDLLDDDDGRQRIGAGTAVGLRYVDGVQVVGDQRVERLLGEAGLLVHRGGERRDFRLGERAHRLAEHVVLLGRPVQIEISGSRHAFSLPCELSAVLTTVK